MELPPSSVSNYPRESYNFDKLRSLAAGCSGLFPFFFVNALIFIFILGTSSSNGDGGRSVHHSREYLIGQLLAQASMFFLISLPTTYFQLKKIGVGLSWGRFTAFIVSFLISISCAFCFGALIYAYVYFLAAKEFRRVGIPSGWWVFHSSKLKSFVYRLEKQQEQFAPVKLDL